MVRQISTTYQGRSVIYQSEGVRSDGNTGIGGTRTNNVASRKEWDKIIQERIEKLAAELGPGSDRFEEEADPAEKYAAKHTYIRRKSKKKGTTNAKSKRSTDTKSNIEQASGSPPANGEATSTVERSSE